MKSSTQNNFVLVKGTSCGKVILTALGIHSCETLPPLAASSCQPHKGHKAILEHQHIKKMCWEKKQCGGGKSKWNITELEQRQVL